MNDGSLGTPEAQAILERVERKVKDYAEQGDEIIFTMDTHEDNYLETSEGKRLPVKHCIYRTRGWEISHRLSAYSRKCVEKHTFGWTKWPETFQEYGISPEKLESIELVGLCTDICVVSNALILKALLPDIKISVDAGCCAGVTPETHRAALQTMGMCQIEVTGETEGLC